MKSRAAQPPRSELRADANYRVTAQLDRLRTVLHDSGTAPEVRNRGPSDGGAIPVHKCLRPLVPGGVLTRGTIVAIPPRTAPWPSSGAAPSYVALALLAATEGGAWGAAIGHPAFGVAAALGLGADPLQDDVARRARRSVARCRRDPRRCCRTDPAASPTGEQLRRLTSRVRTSARQRDVALIFTGSWSGAHLTLQFPVK